MADDAPDKNEPTTVEVATPAVKAETAGESPAKASGEIPAEEPQEKVTTSPAKTPPASVETVPVTAEEAPATTVEGAPTVAVAAESPAAPAEKTSAVAAETVPAVSAVESQPQGSPGGSPAKIIEKEVKTKSVEIAKTTSEASTEPEAVTSATVVEPVAEKADCQTVPEKPVVESTVPVDPQELPQSPTETPQVSAESVSAPPAENTAELPTETVPESSKEEPAAEPPVEKTEESPSQKPAEASSASPEAGEPIAQARDEEQKDETSPSKVPEAPVEAESKPSADDSGIQEPDGKFVEGNSVNESQGGERDAGAQEAVGGQPQNVVDGGMVERPGDGEGEEWSDEDEGNASYGGEHGASPPKKSETVSDEEANLDFDEDKSNPQYIPKKGAFYEHDDRRGTDDEDEAAEEEANKDKEAEESEVAGGSKDSPEHRRAQRVLQSETKDRWDHDMFDPNEQGPKTSDELVQQYGYDIRDESSAPRAAGRRRYGRGPNKYTRDWQDEKAYHGKTHNAQERREKEFHPRKDDFPCLPLAQRPREQQNLKESKDHQVREERQEHPRDNRRQNDRAERPERSDRPESKDPRRSDQGRDNPRKDRRDLRNKLDANRHENQRFDSRKPQRNEGWGGGDNGGHRDHGHRDNGGGRPRGGGGDHRDFRDNGHRENFQRENSHRENWRDNRDSYRDNNNRDAGRGENRESGRDARDGARGDVREGGRDNREGGREIIMRQDRKIGSGRTQEPRNSRKPTEARNGEFAEQRRLSDDKRAHVPQQNGTTAESKRYTQQRAAARGDAPQAAVSQSQAQPAAAQAQPQQAAHHSMPAPPRQAHAPQQPMPPQHVPQQQAYYELPPGPAPYFVPQFDGAAGPPQNFIQPNPFMNHPTAYIAPPAPAAHPYMMSPEGPVAEVYAPAPGANGAPGGITYYSATQQMYMAHQQQQSQPRRKAAIPIKPPPDAKHQHVEPKPLET